MKSFGGQPARRGLEVGVGGSKLRAELLGSQPDVMLWRIESELIVQQLAQGGFLFWCALQQQEHAIQGLRITYGAPVKFGLRQRMDIAVEEHQLFFVDGLGDSRRAGSRLRCAGLIGLRRGGGGQGGRKQSKRQEPNWRKLESAINRP